MTSEISSISILLTILHDASGLLPPFFSFFELDCWQHFLLSLLLKRLKALGTMLAIAFYRTIFRKALWAAIQRSHANLASTRLAISLTFLVCEPQTHGRGGALHLSNFLTRISTDITALFHIAKYQKYYGHTTDGTVVNGAFGSPIHATKCVRSWEQVRFQPPQDAMKMRTDAEENNLWKVASRELGSCWLRIAILISAL